MSNEMFKQHHPHRLSDYIGRGLVEFARGIVSVVGRRNFAIRSIISNTILSSFSMILANSLHHKLVFRGIGDREKIENLLCEASGIHFHVIVARKLTTPSKWQLILLYILRTLAIWKFKFISFIAPKVAHRILGYIYEKSISDYSNWIDFIKHGGENDTEASPISIAYFELKKEAMLSDVLSAMRDDCVKYRDDEHRQASR